MAKLFTDEVSMYVDHEEVVAVHTMRYDLDLVKILIRVRNIDCIEKFIDR